MIWIFSKYSSECFQSLSCDILCEYDRGKMVVQLSLRNLKNGSVFPRVEATVGSNTYVVLSIHLALACSVTFQYASTGTQVKIDVNNVVTPQATQIAIVTCSGIRISRTVNIRLY